MRIDARVPVRIETGPSAPRPDALLLMVGERHEVDRTGWAAVRVVPVPAAAHRPGCACCGGPDGLARVLGELFRQRATAILPFFRSITVRLPPGLVDGAWRSLAEDRVLAARFRPDR